MPFHLRFNGRRLLRRHRVTALAAAAAASLIATTSPSAASASTSDQSTAATTASITMWFDTEPGPINDYILALAKSFDAAHPGDKITVDFFANTPYKQKVLLAMSAKKPPAIFYSWGGGILRSYINAGDVASLGPTSSSWAANFLPSALGAVTFDGQLYGVPVQGTQPVYFYYNKAIFAKFHLGFPKTWSQLLADVATFNKGGQVPIVLGDLSGWEGLTYLEYLTDRIGGPSVFDAIQSGRHDAWDNPAIIKALQDIQQLVKAHAFETGYDAIDYGPETDAMLSRGVGAMELMGDWDLGTLIADAPSFLNKDLGQAPFPVVQGGIGNPADLVGNTTTYLAVANVPLAQRKVAEQFVETELNTRTFAKTEVAAGQVPVIKGTADLLTGQPLSKFLVPIYNSVAHAPSFQYSWDQALGATRAQPMLNNLEKIFELDETPEQFVAALDGSGAGV